MQMQILSWPVPIFRANAYQYETRRPTTVKSQEYETFAGSNFLLVPS